MKSIVFIGEVDHGKSTLVGRLLRDTGSLPEGGIPEDLAFVTDRFEEEKQEQRTIDSAEVFLRWKGERWSLIDVPGHQEFLHHMMTGASRADAAVLVVDGTEGISEQTRRHVRIAGLLGVRDFVVAVNKMDRLGFSEAAFQGLVRELGILKVSSRGIVPLSARDGGNVVDRGSAAPWYTGKTLLELLEESTTRSTCQSGPLRVVVQDRIDGVALGRVESGILRKGERVGLAPGGRSFTVERLCGFPTAPDRAGAGEGVAFPVGEGVERGCILFDPGRVPSQAGSMRASILWLSRDAGLDDEFTLECSVQSVPARVGSVHGLWETDGMERREKPEPGFLLDAELRWEGELVTDPFSVVPALGRFVLRRGSEVVAAGVRP